MNLQSAKHAAKSLTAYWAARGLVVQAVIVTEYQALNGEAGSHRQFTIRTIPPMVAGLPRDARPIAGPGRHWRGAVASHFAKGQ